MVGVVILLFGGRCIDVWGYLLGCVVVLVVFGVGVMLLVDMFGCDGFECVIY